MSTKTPKIGLNKPGSGEYGWDALLSQNIDTLDAYVGQLLDERAVSGTATGGSATTITDNGANWGTDAFAGAIVVVRRDGVLLRTEKIASNTATTITLAASGAAIQSGDSYVIMAQANAIPNSEKGQPNGVATLDAAGKLAQMPTADDINPSIMAHVNSPHAPANAEQNRPIATQAQALAGTDNTTDMTPLRAKQAIDAAIAAIALPPKRDVTWLSKSPGNCFSIIMNGRLYNAHATAASWWHATGRTSGTDWATEFGVRHGLIEVLFPNETGNLVEAGNTWDDSWALFDNGNLYMWGYNQFGQLGVGDTAAHWTPVLSATGVSKVFAPQHYGTYGDYIRFFIQKTDGTIWGAGYNGFGALGDGTTVDKTTWTQITSLGTNTVKLFNLGGYVGCTFALKSDGSIWACGYNGYGCLGDGTLTNRSSFVDVTTNWGGPAADILQMGGGFSFYTGAAYDNRCFTVMLRKDSAGNAEVRTCGNSSWGQRGDGTTVNTASVPYLVPLANQPVEMAVFGGAPGTIYVRDSANQLLAWGYNGYGQIGDGTTANKTSATVVATDCAKLFGDGNDEYYYGHYVSGFYRNLNGQLMGTGYNAYGELGIGNTTQQTTFQQVMLPYATSGQIVDLGWFASTGQTKTYIARMADGRLFAWGYNGQQNIGNAAQNVVAPVQIDLPQL